MRAVPVFLIVVPLFFLAIGSQALAATVVETDEYTVELRGMAEAGVVAADATHLHQSGPLIGLARISGRAVYEDLGRVFVQYKAASGNVSLHDALAVVYLAEGLHLRLGYFKTPVSADYNVSTSQKPFPGRALLTSLTPRRGTGGELYYEAPLAGEMTAEFSLGAFAPLFLAEPSTNAMLMTGRMGLNLPVGLGFRVGYADHFDRAVWPDEEEEPFFVEQPRLIDLAVTFSDDDWFGHIEAVVAPHRAPLYTPAGIYLAAGHRFGTIEEEPTIEPVVGYDFIAPGGDTAFHRLRAGVNGYLLDYRIVPNLHYEMTVDADGAVGHAAFALLRIGI